MAITRINNNQITDSATGNVYLGVNAAAKLQDFSITSGKIANDLTYGSDLTITGNLTVQGNTTAIDTVNLVVEDPLILLAKEQTSSPTLDIGFIGKRGTEDNIAFVWDESADQFVAVFTTSEVTNSTISINSYASLQVLDITAANANITGNLTFDGNIVGNVTVTGNVNADNLNATTNVTGTTITASGNLEGGNAVITGDVGAATVTATGNVAGGNLTTGGVVAATGNVTGGNLTTGGEVVATGNVSGGNITTVGNIDGANLNATANVTGAGAVFSGNVTADTFFGNISGNIDAGGANTEIQFNDDDVLAGSAAFTFDKTSNAVTATGNITGGNLNTAGEVVATGNVAGGNVNTGGEVVATGNVTGGNLNTAGEVVATGNVTGGNLNTAGEVVATGNVTGGNLTTAGNIDGGNVNATAGVTAGTTVVATGNVSGGNITTGGQVVATGNVTGGNLTTGGEVVATGNVAGGNITTAGNIDGANVNATAGITAGTTVVATGNVSGGNITTGGVVAATGNVAGGNITTGGQVVATGNVTGGNLTTAGNVDGANLNASSTVTAVDVIASGNVDGANVNTDSIVGTAISITATSVDMNLTGNLIMSGRYINQVADPVSAQDAATKQYVDDAVSAGLTIHTPVRVAACNVCIGGTYAQGGTTATVTDTVAGNTVVFSSAISPQVNDQYWFDNSFNGIVGNVPYFVVSAPNTSAAVLSTTYNGEPVSNITTGGSLTESVRINSGQGATLTNSAANAALVIDGVTVNTNDRVGVFFQNNPIQNGVYEVTDPGNVSAAWVLTRSQDMDTYIPDDVNGLDSGDYFYIQEGAAFAGESYVMTDPVGPVIIGYANLTFTQFSASQVYSANTSAGLVLNGTIFSAKVDNDTTAFDGGGNIIVKTGANLVTPNIGDAIGNSLTLGGNGLLSATTVTATGNVSGGNLTTAGNVDGANVNASAGITAGTTVVATGNVIGGNLNTAGVVVATGNVTGGNITTGGEVVATGNVTGGNLTTAGNIDGANVNATGIVTATGNVSGGNLTTGGVVAATGNVSGGNLNTGGEVVATGNVTGGNVNTGGEVVATGNVSGGNINTGGEVVATGNVSGGNLSAGSGIIVTTGNIDGANLNATANVTGAGAVFSGNVTADTFIGNIQGNIDAGGANTNIQFNDDDVLAGSAAFTFDKTSNAVTATGNITGGNLITAGNVDGANVNASAGITAGTTVVATGNVSGGNITTAGNIDGANVNASAGITAGTTVVATGNVSGGNITTLGNVDGANVNATAGITAGTTVDATGNITGGNLITTGTADLGNIRITGNDITNFASNIITINAAASDIDFVVSGDTVTSLLVVDAGTDTVVIGTANATTGAALKVDTTDSMMVPVGNTAQRPGTPEIGMFRFNTGGDALEVYTSGGWEDVGVPAFTVIIADAFVGDGSTLAFTLSANSTTAGTIVAINGIVQEPTTAYSVSGTTLTFTEAPVAQDNIDARILTTTTTVTQIENSSGNAVVAVLDTADTVEITGNLLPATTNTYNLGSDSLRWSELFLEGSTITLGNVVIKNTSGNTIGFFGPDGTTPGTIDTNNIDSASISNGTSNVAVIASGGNVDVNVGGNPIVTFWSGGVDNRQANGVGNIGTASSYFNTVFAKATSAQYADLAEMYEADAQYEPGTVLCFGGSKEVTTCDQADSTRVAGVVSTNPSYLMNSGQIGECVAAVALTGRVPTRVTGIIRKGDLMVSTGDGRARANNAAAVGTVIGKALADFDGTDGVIEVVVGRV